MLESDEEPKPLLVAGGAGSAGYSSDVEFGRGNMKQAAIGNNNVGTSGKQKFIVGDKKDVYCGGAGFYEAPTEFILAKGCVAPKSYEDGLRGGKGFDEEEEDAVFEGGFGGGGGFYKRKLFGERIWKYYKGAGGGFTGGSTKVDDEYPDEYCNGGGGGSFSTDPNAKFDNEYVEFGYCKIERQ